MEQDIAVGPEGKLVIKEEGGKIILQFVHTHASGSVSVMAVEDMKYFLEQLRPILPPWASIAINLAEAALP